MSESEKDAKLLRHVKNLHEILTKTEKHEANHEINGVNSEDNQETIQKFLEEIKRIKEEDENPSSDETVKTALRLIMNTESSATEYYSKNTDKLIKDIKDSIKRNIYVTSVLNVDDNPIWREINLEIIYFYGNILNSSAPERYQEVIDFIEYAFANPDKIIQEFQEKHNQSKETTNELGLYTADPLSVMFSGKATGTLGKLKTVGTINDLQKTANVKGVKIISQNISQMGVGEAKIFRYALAAFTQKNSTGTSNSKLNLRMFLSLDDYAQATNTDISTEYGRKNFKKKLKKNLENLMEKHISFSWIEDVRGKTKSYGGLSLISGYKISKDAITVDFSLGFAEYLVSLPTLVEYPRALYSVNDRNYNAFAIGEAMFQHYSINNNVIKGTEQMLSVQKILEVTSFPTYEKVKEEHHSWEFLIKEQLEKALDHLYECELIKDWCYSQAKGKKLTDEEAKRITSYEKFASLYIWYELNAYPDHNERAGLIIEAKEKRLQKLKKKKPKSKNNEQNPSHKKE